MPVFLSFTLGLATSAMLAQAQAQAQAPAPSIAGATLDQYRNEYQHSPLCARDEITLWTCTRNRQVFSLCSSQVATRTTGYLQYRASHAGKPTFTYPAVKTPPRGLFTYISSANGDASIEFANGGYRYELADPLRAASRILISAPGASGKTTTISCGPNQTLQVNYTMRLMGDFGLWPGDGDSPATPTH